ncbi:chaperone protein dnaJ-like protein [Perilla frutescens var. hirtella]|uniref:Chaperone protein dnaJ-like protein n=1 Tax=Perilla frutescens var. hirtella TaxID=608512 RepID=A0AAD4J9C1_PERFH|nr:chaperone protein dnaJ-like protein [Perilla frutescens var. frutescens]KAH6829580.1 chaperone protein dnaJ-like protein [Perilla frutescens var. hirtella]
MEQPLLSAEKRESESSYDHAGRAASVIPPASIAGSVVSVDEIRSVAASSDIYPPSLHAPLLSSPQPHYPSEQVLGYPQDAYYGHFRENAINGQRQVLDEVEIRELLLDHVGHRCCWGSRPARSWTIHAVEDCNVYVGTLETFAEDRETITEKEPYLGGDVDGKDKGPELGLWELDLRSEFPPIFIPEKESRIVIPHSEAIEKCSGCRGRGNIVCLTCNADQEPGFFNANRMFQCSTCNGRGLLAHMDGSDTICKNCTGKGMIPCATCGSQGLIQCETCQGGGSLLTRKVAVVRWTTLQARKVSATTGAASVPDEVFHRAKGVQLCNTQAHQCTPAYFADSYFLNKFSSEVIAERAQVSPTARVICERHTISVVPVTRVTMTHRRSSFSFYIIGTAREVYLKDSYPSRFCWGLCPCLEWLKL